MKNLPGRFFGFCPVQHMRMILSYTLTVGFFQNCVASLRTTGFVSIREGGLKSREIGLGDRQNKSGWQVRLGAASR
jgi:hypothetical protein